MLKTTLIQKVLLVLFGIVCSLIIVSICLQVTGFVYLISQERRNRVSLLRGSEYRILFLGESTTAEGGWNSYPRKLGRILEHRLPGRKFAIINKGSPGIDTTYILSKLEYNLDQYQPNMVVVMMGINDVVAGAPERQNVPKFKKFVKDLRLYKLLKFFLARLHEKDMLKEIYLARAWYFQEVDNYPKAERLFRKAIAIRPKDYDIYLEFARYYVEREDYPKAEEIFTKAIEAAKNNYMPYIEFGKYYRERENYQKSQEMFNDALEVSGGDYRAFFELGQCYAAENEFSNAQEAFRQCIKANRVFSEV